MKKYLLLISVTLTSVNVLFADKALNDAAKDGNLNEVIRLIEPYKNNEVALKNYVNWQDDDNDTALMFAVMKGQTEIVQILIKAGADLNIQDKHGNTAMRLAVMDDQTEIVQILIAAGANPNIQGQNGSTVLTLAVMNDQTEIVQILIAAGADLNIQDKNGNTAMRLAMMDDQTEIAKLLIAAGANPNIQNKNGNTAMTLAVILDQTEIAKLLIAAGANPNIQNKHGKTALGLVQERRHNDIIALLTNYAEEYNIIYGMCKKAAEELRITLDEKESVANPDSTISLAIRILYAAKNGAMTDDTETAAKSDKLLDAIYCQNQNNHDYNDAQNISEEVINTMRRLMETETETKAITLEGWSVEETKAITLEGWFYDKMDPISPLGFFYEEFLNFEF
ncbi:MAG: hypothetical protein A2Y14_00705 [Verrucomicrobia bacterium GWF2_51_19]|nr:MAG: hypothetical protein A2Y14_00705 [Verrucomicrobia bacterium GWF2_51_19]HCJ12221.1 hypothetical protein [Opitutae bacterium]